ncbi:MAG: hypothetical protein PCFJNLEI_03565 [Verrucomicrobiae bacterium]|nr:hypothetical protein [Verrucomicrobiae bacterium]
MTSVALAAEDPARRVLIVYNAAEPASEPLARYYAAHRNIPTNQICRVNVRNAETITRREYNEQIRDPLWKFLVAGGWLYELGGKAIECRIDCLALMYGMPLRIDADPTLKEVIPATMPQMLRRNEAAVDSELTLLPAGGSLLTGWVVNPNYNARILRLGATMLLVGRLDGATPAIARQLIDDAIATEQYGLLGRCYFDSRNIQEPGYKIGDEWLKTAAGLFRAAGYETELDERPELFPADYPLTDAAVYAGWYTGGVTGPFRRADFRFRRGAVAYHIHSGSAASVRTESAYWTGPLLAKGAAVSFGNVYEPYLAYTPHLDKFFKRLLDGATYLEAGWSSQPGLSWQTTFLGDPLYRPFAVPVDEQIRRLEHDHHPDREWAYLRQVNLLLTSGKTNAAVKLCQSQALTLTSPVLMEKLADLLPASEQVAGYEAALKIAGDSYRYFRIALKLATAYSANQKPKQALAVYEGLAATHPQGRNARLVLQKARDLAKLSGAPDQAEKFQKQLDAVVAAEMNEKKQ